MPADQGREYSVIVDGARTAFGRYGGALAPLSAVDLGAAAIRGALERTGGMVKDEDLDHIRHVHMGIHNSKMAEEFSISREEQDAWALRSHQLALAAQDEGRLGEEIVAVGVAAICSGTAQGDSVVTEVEK